jgi:transposase
MRQAHHAGEKSFIDFSGSGLDVVHPLTGECQKAVLFLAVLGASNLTYAEPVLHQDLPYPLREPRRARVIGALQNAAHGGP